MDNIKAIFMDLDGTVLTSEHKVSENLIRKLREVEEKGVKIFIATGRTFSSSKPFVEMLGIKNPVINYNGGRITNPLNSEVIFEKPVEAQDVKELIKISRKKGIHLNLYMDDKLYIENETDEGTKYSESVEIPYYVKNFDEFIGKTSTKALFIAENSILLELKKELEEKLPHINFVFSKPHYLECLNKEVNKGLAIKELLKKYDISPEETIAFGDQWNDLEMLKFVKYGYLMGNATEELKQEFSKDKITLSNDEDGIYEVIKAL